MTKKSEPEYESHPSYGTISLTRWSSSNAHTLFGSPVKSRSGISLKIHRAERKRNLGQDWIHGSTELLVEVHLSETQFARAITSIGQGDGLPCTISYVGGERMPDPPPEKQAAQLRAEMQEAVGEAVERLRGLHKQAEEMLDGGTVSKKALKELVHDLHTALINVQENLPFQAEQVQRTLEKVVVQAKAEIDIYAARKATELGLAAGSLPQLPAGFVPTGEEPSEGEGAQ